MTGPDEGTRAGRGHLRAAQADREQAITVLKAAYAQGRLTKDELELRAGQAFASKTYAELAALTADIPRCFARRFACCFARREAAQHARPDVGESGLPVRGLPAGRGRPGGRLVPGR